MYVEGTIGGSGFAAVGGRLTPPMGNTQFEYAILR